MKSPYRARAKVMKKFVNLTPHTINLNNGDALPPSGTVARVSASYTDFDDGVCHQVFGDVQGLPDPQDGVLFVVSALVLAASDRDDLVAPATGHADCVRVDGLIKSVPGFVRK